MRPGSRPPHEHRRIGWEALPFVGLRPFEPDDAAFFFGRARKSASVAGALLGNALTVLFGPPGAGKTSLIQVRVAGANGRRDR